MLGDKTEISEMYRVIDGLKALPSDNEIRETIEKLQRKVYMLEAKKYLEGNRP